ncbi:MAG: restriction endonuclease subunit S [Deltaproteobacteria bacterium]|nr:restriction endonuclease subunit S [Deltaproteobacteria bacterium]
MPKKKPKKSLDELLEEAIVEENEQPYEVPGNWVFTKLGSICTKPQYGWTTKAKQEGDVYLVRTTDITSGNLDWQNVPYCSEVPKDLSKYLLKEDDIVISRAGSIGVSYLIEKPKKAVFASYLIRFNPIINKKYVYLFLKSPIYWSSISEKSSGIALPNINATKLGKIQFPLPPLPEQKRIVKKLSSMLGKLKEARELIQETRDTFEERRAAILNKAFTGELTKKWREENPDVEPASMLLNEIRREKKTLIVKNRIKENMPHTDISYLPPLPTKWEWAIVGEISDKIHYGYTAKSEGNPIGPKLLRITDIQNDTVDWNIVPYCKIDENQKTKYFLREGDLVFARTGATVGKSYLLSGKFPESVFASYLIRIIINERVSNRYISNFFKSPSYWRQITSGQVGIGQPNVNAKTLSKIILPLPPFSEQKEIVRILDKLLDHEDEARALIDMEEHIDLLEKSILSKAFRGELGTNDTDDEPAIELLKRSLKEKM